MYNNFVLSRFRVFVINFFPPQADPNFKTDGLVKSQKSKHVMNSIFYEFITYYYFISILISTRFCFPPSNVSLAARELISAGG